MAVDPAYALQVAFVAGLKALGTAAGTRVYDRVPDTETFPYITVGEGQIIPIEEECFDRSESTHQINVWSRAVGYPEVKQLAGAIRAALNHGSFSVTGHTVDLIRVTGIDYTRDPDGITNRARIQVETQTSPI